MQAVRPTAPVIHLVPTSLPSGVKRPGPEAYHSLPLGGEVNGPWSYTSTVPIPLHVMVLN